MHSSVFSFALLTDLNSFSTFLTAISTTALAVLTFWLGKSALNTFKNQVEQRKDDIRPHLAFSSFEYHREEILLGYGVMLNLENLGKGPARLRGTSKEGNIIRADLDTPLGVGVGNKARVKLWLPEEMLSLNGCRFQVDVYYLDLFGASFKTVLNMSLWLKKDEKGFTILYYILHSDDCSPAVIPAQKELDWSVGSKYSNHATPLEI